MLSLKEYLCEKGKFHSPTPGETRENTLDVSTLEASQLEKLWKPPFARYDALLETLEDYLGDRPLTSPQIEFDRLFQPTVDFNGKSFCWIKNETERQARRMVDFGPICALDLIMQSLGCEIDIDDDARVPGFASQVDILILGRDGEKIFVEVKAPRRKP